MNEMTLYGCQDLIQAIEAQAEANDGELTDDQLQAIVEAHTTSLAKLASIGGLIQYLDGYVDAATNEMSRIQKLKRKAQNRLESVKRFVLPYIQQEKERMGRPVEAGTHKFSTRTTKAVVITDPESFDKGCFPDVSTKKVTYTPDKAALREHIEKNGSHPGAELETHTSLIVK